MKEKTLPLVTSSSSSFDALVGLLVVFVVVVGYVLVVFSPVVVGMWREIAKGAGGGIFVGGYCNPHRRYTACVWLTGKEES